MLSTLLALSSLAALASAQAPPYTGQLLIQPGNSAAKCLKVNNENGAPVTLQACTGNTNQLWTFEGGSIKIFGTKCLDVKDGGTANGTPLQIYDCTAGNKNQQFTYTKFGDNHIAWTNSAGKCLDLTGGSLSNGNVPQIYDCSSNNANQIWNVGYMPNALPQTSENGQTGTNNCGTGSSQTSMCQTAYINDADDFCLWAPPKVGSIGDTEREEVSWCTKPGRGTRVIPAGALKGVHFVRTPSYVQVTGVGNFTKINVKSGDEGGELDPHGADGNGNPVGGLVYGTTFSGNGELQQYHEWTSFMSDSEFCFRACTGGPQARELCQHIYDVMGCFWNMPANYDSGTFESCKADDDLPMGVYGTSTWHQGTKPTPSAHPVAPSSSCTAFPSPSPPAAKAAITSKVATTSKAAITSKATATSQAVPVSKPATTTQAQAATTSQVTTTSLPATTSLAAKHARNLKMQRRVTPPMA
jgi:hypothetical protein